MSKAKEIADPRDLAFFPFPAPNKSKKIEDTSRLSGNNTSAEEDVAVFSESVRRVANASTLRKTLSWLAKYSLALEKARSYFTLYGPKVTLKWEYRTGEEGEVETFECTKEMLDIYREKFNYALANLYHVMRKKGAKKQVSVKEKRTKMAGVYRPLLILGPLVDLFAATIEAKGEGFKDNNVKSISKAILASDKYKKLRKAADKEAVKLGWEPEAKKAYYEQGLGLDITFTHLLYLRIVNEKWGDRPWTTNKNFQSINKKTGEVTRKATEDRTRFVPTGDLGAFLTQGNSESPVPYTFAKDGEKIKNKKGTLSVVDSVKAGDVKRTLSTKAGKNPTVIGEVSSGLDNAGEPAIPKTLINSILSSSSYKQDIEPNDNYKDNKLIPVLDALLERDDSTNAMRDLLLFEHDSVAKAYGKAGLSLKYDEELRKAQRSKNAPENVKELERRANALKGDITDFEMFQDMFQKLGSESEAMMKRVRSRLQEEEEEEEAPKVKSQTREKGSQTKTKETEAPTKPKSSTKPSSKQSTNLLGGKDEEA